ncbi:MAG TPA: hypothetical protein PLF91_15685, partial [Mycolicibacterium fallax]|nr:hypothetical protein [Mycolicibacterium fallax]
PRKGTPHRRQETVNGRAGPAGRLLTPLRPPNVSATKRSAAMSAVSYLALTIAIFAAFGAVVQVLER